MKIIVIEYPDNREGKKKYGYYFEHEKKQYHYLFRNFGTVGKNGVITEDSPQEIIEWFKDIQGDPMSTAAGYGVKNATTEVEKCNKQLGCSSTCDFSKKQKCDKLIALEYQRNELSLTQKFMDQVINEGFTEFKNEWTFDQHIKMKS